MTFEQKLEGGGEVSHMESGRRKFQIEGRTVSSIHWKTGRRSVGLESRVKRRKIATEVREIKG